MVKKQKNKGRSGTSRTKRAPSSTGISLTQLLALTDDEVARLDIAVANIACAEGLPGMGPFRFEHYLNWLDEAARLVRLETDRNYYKFLNDPSAFNHSQARFCMVALVTVLQQHCGVRYNSKWKGLTPDSPIPEMFGIDAIDLFIPAIIEGIGGTCSSLPVLYIAVGRRLGYPLKIVKAARHLFVRWDDPDGKVWHRRDRFNIEATGSGIHFLPDDHYRNWPHPVSNEDVESGVFLKSLTPHEEFAEFVAMRGHCLQANRQLKEAMQAFGDALRLAPSNNHYAAAVYSLRMHMDMCRRGHADLNTTIGTLEYKSVGPFWLNGIGGDKVLVQIVSPVRQVFDSTPDIGIQLIQHMLQTPNGLHVDVWLPSHESASKMSACWVRLSNGRWALIHKTNMNIWGQPIPPYAVQNIWQKSYHGPILHEDEFHLGQHWRQSLPEYRNKSLPAHELTSLASRVELALLLMDGQATTPTLPNIQPLTLSTEPSVPMLSNTRTRTHHPNIY